MSRLPTTQLFHFIQIHVPITEQTHLKVYIRFEHMIIQILKNKRHRAMPVPFTREFVMHKTHLNHILYRKGVLSTSRTIVIY